MKPLGRRPFLLDVIESLSDFSRYRLVVAPMLFMLKPGLAERLRAFVEKGGTLVLSHLSGWVNETNLVSRGGLPGGAQYFDRMYSMLGTRALRHAASTSAETWSSCLRTARIRQSSHAS